MLRRRRALEEAKWTAETRRGDPGSGRCFKYRPPPGCLYSVRSGLCGSHNSEIVSYIRLFSPNPSTGRGRRARCAAGARLTGTSAWAVGPSSSAPPSPPANLPVTLATVLARQFLSLQLIQSSPFLELSVSDAV
ncbi:hypothetical protein SEVIR_2G331402v4 [Setaria viridis]